MILSPGNSTDPSGLALSGDDTGSLPGNVVLEIPQEYSLLRVLPIQNDTFFSAIASSGEAAQVCPGWIRGLQDIEPYPEQALPGRPGDGREPATVRSHCKHCPGCLFLVECGVCFWWQEGSSQPVPPNYSFFDGRDVKWLNKILRMCCSLCFGGKPMGVRVVSIPRQMGLIRGLYFRAPGRPTWP